MMNASLSSRCFTAALAAATVGAALAAPAMGGTEQSLSYDYYHQKLGMNYPAVGQVNTFTKKGQQFIGSGTLIAPRWVLTAAHVVQNGVSLSFTPGHYDGANAYQPEPFGPNGFQSPGFRYVHDGTYGAKAWYTPPNYQGEKKVLSGGDIALLHLSQPVKGIKPLQYTKKWRGGRKPFGKKSTIVGVGRLATGFSGELANGLDLKRRAGRNNIDGRFNRVYPTYKVGKEILPVGGDFDRYDLDGDLTVADPLADDGTFNKDDIPLPLEYSGAHGDSGGPLFVDGKIAAIVSGGIPGNPHYKGYGFNTDILTYSNWIRKVETRIALHKGNFSWFTESDFSDPLVFKNNNNQTQSSKLNLYEAAVPEPATLSLLGLAGFGLIGRRPRRRGA